ncbi:peptidase domain-containing ABC transporter, partial [Thiohalorhabdus sp. Cl-TMA]
MEHLESELHPEDFFWALASSCHLNRIPFESGQALECFPPPYDQAEILSALGEYGVEAETKQIGKHGLEGLDVPCLAFFQSDGDEEAGEWEEQQGEEEYGGNTVRPALIVESNENKLTYFIPDEEQPRTLPISAFKVHFKSEVVVLRAVEDDGGAEPEGIENRQSFGFRWFIPELLRYKPIWRDVLLASLFIQVLGLATPLFTQVIIDKAIVHEALNTLGVIAVALFMFMVFSSVMTWVRQYLII